MRQGTLRIVRPDPEPIAPATDAEIIVRVKRGDLGAFDTLVRRHLPQATRMARRLLAHREDAEDLVQDAFLRALQRLDLFDERRPFAPWFFRLLTNLGLNARRRRARRATVSAVEDTLASDETPHDHLEQREVWGRFARALDTLSPRQRLILTLSEVDGRSTEETAAIVGIDPATVRWHIHRARRTLRQSLPRASA